MACLLYKTSKNRFFTIYFACLLWEYRGLQGVTEDYKSLQAVTRGYKGLHGVTRGYTGLQGVTGG